MKKRAIISVSDKNGIVDFATELANLDYEIVSTGGTYKILKEGGVKVTYISEITNFPEILDGRVKTLHPAIHAGILAKRAPDHLKELAEQKIEPIDLVVVNLYPFKQVTSKDDVSLEEAIENIDIGGPTMLRAAAKNYKSVTVVVNPNHYNDVINEIKNNGEISLDNRLKLSFEAFRHTAEYDSCISNYLEEKANINNSFPNTYLLCGDKEQDLRYGENPHQKAAFYRNRSQGACIGNAKQLHGKELSFNNIIDANAALEAVREFSEPAAVVVKHTNPCGTAIADNISEAYERAFNVDSVSAYGGIVGLNREVDVDTANLMKKIFLEAVIAPSFSTEAKEILQEKKNIRLLEVGELTPCKDLVDLKTVNGGFLIQESDLKDVNADDLKTVSKRKPTDEDIKELLFAWKVVKHVKSNAIVITKDGQSIGVGAGQMNRVGSAGIAINQGGKACKDAYLASDAYFPFRDTVDAAAKAGIKALIQPGGSIRDNEAIEAADEHNMILLFTGVRHFKH